MPPALAHTTDRVRRVLARLVGSDADPTAASLSTNLPLTIRAMTADDADVRLLVEACVLSHDDGTETERVVHAIVLPAAARWVHRRDLSTLEEDLDPLLHEITLEVRDELEGLGVRLLNLSLVAAEHLLASPSGAEAHGPD